MKSIENFHFIIFIFFLVTRIITGAAFHVAKLNYFSAKSFQRQSKLSSHIEGNDQKYEIKELYDQPDDRNEEIVKLAVDYFSTPGYRRGNIQLPPGWGKTQAALQVLERLFYLHQDAENEKEISSVYTSVYVTPSLKLVDQVLDSLDRFGTFGDINCDYLIVASKTGRKDIAYTTDSDEIGEFLMMNPTPSKKSMRFIVSTYQSLPKVGIALKEVGRKMNFAIFDEAHQMEGIGKVYGIGLYDDKVPIEKRLFTTATARNFINSTKQVPIWGSMMRRDGSIGLVPRGGNMTSAKDVDSIDEINGEEKIKTLVDDNVVRSFTDQDLFGRCIAKRTQLESEKRNITVPLTLCALDKSEIISLIGPSASEADWDMISRDNLLPFAIQAAFQKVNATHAVSFHSFNKRAREFAISAQQAFKDDIKVFCVDGSMSPKIRDGILEDAKTAPKSIVSNCRLLATGVDESNWDMVVLGDPIRSQVNARQMIGRVTRKAPNKERGYVLVPMWSEEDFEGSGELSGGYAIFSSAFSAMVGLDPDLREDVLFVIDEMAKKGRELSTEEFPERVRDCFMLPSSMSFETKTTVMNRVIVEFNGENRWNKMFDLLVRYNEREGHCKVPWGHTEDGTNLGEWLSNQRQNKKKGILDPIREKRLEELGVMWDVAAEEWEKNYMLLVQFQQREGHCKVPVSHKEDGINLGQWLSDQRKLKKKSVMDPIREKRLEELGVMWDVKAEEWEKNYMLLVQFQQREGHCKVSQHHTEDGTNLGEWLSKQRQNKKKGVMDPIREKRLEELGMMWDVAAEEWEKNYMLLVQFQRREGHCKVPLDHTEDDTNLGQWLGTQRGDKKKGKMDPIRENKLEELGVMWDVAAEEWDKTYMLLVQFHRRKGHCKVPVSYTEDGKNLGKWLGTQRQEKKKGILDPIREKKLEELGMMWDVAAEEWEKNYMLLVQFQQREGHCKVPYDHTEDGTNLGEWLSNQRTYKKKGILDPIREKKLEELGMTWDVNAEEWDKTYMLLVQFQQREGHCKVSQRHSEDGTNLGKWLGTQRQEKKKGILDPIREKKLEELGVMWDVAAEEWEKNYMLLVQFQQREGHCKVAKNHTEDGTNLGTWLNKQRRDKKKDILDSIRENKLEELGVMWDVKAEEWEKNYMLLVQFNQREGHCKVSQRHTEDGTNLGTWLSNQRKDRKKGILDPIREKKLEELGMTWDVKAEEWEKNYMLLVQFHQREGHCNVSRGHTEDGKNLGEWLRKQRLNKEKGKLDLFRQRKLEQLGIVWIPSSKH